MLPVTTNIKDAYKQGRDDEQNFIQNLSLFLCTYLKEHGTLAEKKTETQDVLLEVKIYFLLESRGYTYGVLLLTCQNFYLILYQNTLFNI